MPTRTVREWVDCNDYTVDEILAENEKVIERTKFYFQQEWPALVKNANTTNPEFQRDFAVYVYGKRYRVTYWPSKEEEGRVRVLRVREEELDYFPIWEELS